MSHALFTLLVKAANEEEAKQKAWDLIISHRGNESLYYHGIVVGSELDLEQRSPDTYIWIPKDKTHPDYERHSFIRIVPVNSNDGQKLIKSSYPPKDAKLQDPIYEMLPSGYFCLDERGMCISDPNDNRLRSKDYFVFPVDFHS